MPATRAWPTWLKDAYNLYWYAVNHKGFKVSNSEDYNKPEVKIAAMLGSADVVILQKVAPKATLSLATRCMHKAALLGLN